MVRSGTLPGSFQKLSSLLPAEKSKPWARENAPRISRPAGPAAKDSGGRAFFLDEANVFLASFGQPPTDWTSRWHPSHRFGTCEAASGQKGHGIGRTVYQTQYEHHHHTSHGSPSEHSPSVGELL